MTRWLLWVLIAGCGFGDNGALTGNSRHECGDHVVDVGEGCDDGNTENGDGCSATCIVESVCGNGTREVGEACDDGNVASGDGCSPACQVESASACSLVPQGGCSGGTPACDVADDGSTSCRAVTSMGTSNNHCTTDTACKAGYTCLGDGTAATPWCARFCIADGDCTGTGSRCVIGLANNAGTPLNVKVCSNACDPYGQTGCPSGMGCIGRTSSAGDYTDCRYMGTKLDGETCTSHGDCLAGSACVTANGVSTCRSYCIVGNAGSCPAGETCYAFAGNLTIGSTEYGSCN